MPCLGKLRKSTSPAEGLQKRGKCETSVPNNVMLYMVTVIIVALCLSKECLVGQFLHPANCF